jgi:hypothetical protein
MCATVLASGIVVAMLGRYRIVRGKRPPGDPLPDGVRQDTRKHTRHVLRPDATAVREYLEDPSAAAWRRFATSYRALLDARFAAERAAFDGLAELARAGDLWFGCNCPTATNPDVRRCHTYLALEFFAARYPRLAIAWPVPRNPG